MPAVAVPLACPLSDLPAATVDAAVDVAATLVGEEAAAVTAVPAVHVADTAPASERDAVTVESEVVAPVTVAAKRNAYSGNRVMVAAVS